MQFRLFLRLLVVVSLAVVSSIAIFTSAQEQGGGGYGGVHEMRELLHTMRSTTAPFHMLDTALEAGYGKFLECFRYGDDLGMGQHYVNGDLAGDAMLDPLQPEVLVYEPHEDGNMTLVAFEYLVFADVWDPDDEGREPPVLFGQEFHLKTNIPETPPVWTLHIWIWTHNPDGLFADYNPLVLCAEDEPNVDMAEA